MSLVLVGGIYEWWTGFIEPPKLLFEILSPGTSNEGTVHYGLSPIEKGDIKNFKFKTLLHIQLWSKNVQTFFKWCQTPKSWLLILVFIIYVKYLRSYLQKTWRGGLTNLKFCVLANQLVPKKRVENNIFVRGPLHGANIGQIFSSPFSSENMFWNICSHF